MLLTTPILKCCCVEGWDMNLIFNRGSWSSFPLSRWTTMFLIELKRRGKNTIYINKYTKINGLTLWHRCRWLLWLIREKWNKPLSVRKMELHCCLNKQLHRAVHTRSPIDFAPINKSMMSTDCWLCPYIIDKLIIKVAAFKDLGQQHNTIRFEYVF